MYRSRSLFAAGSRAGIKWAKVEAIAYDAASRIADDFNDDAGGHGVLLADDAYTPAERLYFLIVDDGEFNRDRSDSTEFWESVCDDPQPEDDFLDGFATGLLQVMFPSPA